MVSTEKKLQVLAEIACALNREKVTWAVGASLLLYLKGITDRFHDIDLFVLEQDAAVVQKLLDGMGSRQVSPDSDQYRTKIFLEYEISGVELDVMAGFAIVEEGILHDCSLKPEQITEAAEIFGEMIPLMDLELWITYYRWMHRPRKAERIVQALKDKKGPESGAEH